MMLHQSRGSDSKIISTFQTICIFTFFGSFTISIKTPSILYFSTFSSFYISTITTFRTWVCTTNFYLITNDCFTKIFSIRTLSTFCEIPITLQTSGIFTSATFMTGIYSEFVFTVITKSMNFTGIFFTVSICTWFFTYSFN